MQYYEIVLISWQCLLEYNPGIRKNEEVPVHVIKEAKIVNNGPVASVALYMDKMEETTVFDIYELALEAMTDFPTLRLSDMKVASAGNTHTVGQQAVVFDWPVEDLLASYGVRRIFR